MVQDFIDYHANHTVWQVVDEFLRRMTVTISNYAIYQVGVEHI